MKQSLFLLLLLATSISGMAQDAILLRKKTYNLEKGIAIQGYDPVAYFTASKAVQGKKEFAVAFEGATYYFSSANNKETFKKDPSRYEPQYGGWCAYAMGNDGSTVEIDPDTFKIINGKLYLYYNKYFNNTLKTWNKDEANLKTRADANWQKIYHQ